MNRDEQEIRQLVATWAEATKKGDIPAVLSLMAEDVVFLVPGQPPMIGSAALEAAANAQAMSKDSRPEFEGNPHNFKKKELVGDFKNGGQEWRPKGDPEQVRVYDFVDKTLGEANPYGVYDQTANVGWVSVGVDHDTAEFAVETLRRCWEKMGRLRYPAATELLATADGGGSNGARVRLWKVTLQRLVDQTGLRISVCHFPPGTRKWNKIEHRMFSYISMAREAFN